jgi:hypothetical protein
MQATTRFHDGVPNPILQEANFVFHNPVTLHATNRVFNPHSDGGNPTIRRLLRWGQFPSRWCFLGLEDGDARQEKPLKALILIETTTGWQRIARQFGHALISGFPFTGVAQETHVTGLLDHEEVFERVTLLLTAVIFLLLFGIGRAMDWTFSAILTKRGMLELPSAECVSNIVANSSAGRAGSSSGLAKA